ncbi:hypothetical protein [Sutcliffiella cohnii]|nr:hypothetical protein [Sutcliffiella cohnii]
MDKSKLQNKVAVIIGGTESIQGMRGHYGSKFHLISVFEKI